MHYFDAGQNLVMINKDGIVCRLDTNHLLVEEPLDYQLSKEAIELTEVSFSRRFSDSLANAFIHSLDSETGQ